MTLVITHLRTVCPLGNIQQADRSRVCWAWTDEFGQCSGTRGALQMLYNLNCLSCLETGGSEVIWYKDTDVWSRSIDGRGLVLSNTIWRVFWPSSESSAFVDCDRTEWLSQNMKANMLQQPLSVSLCSAQSLVNSAVDINQLYAAEI